MHPPLNFSFPANSRFPLSLFFTFSNRSPPFFHNPLELSPATTPCFSADRLTVRGTSSSPTFSRNLTIHNMRHRFSFSILYAPYSVVRPCRVIRGCLLYNVPMNFCFSSFQLFSWVREVHAVLAGPFAHPRSRRTLAPPIPNFQTFGLHVHLSQPCTLHSNWNHALSSIL